MVYEINLRLGPVDSIFVREGLDALLEEASDYVRAPRVNCDAGRNQKIRKKGHGPTDNSHRH